MTKKKTVLLVDDDIDYLFQQKAALEQAGFTVRTAEGRHEARDVLSEIVPDCAVLDLMMEEKDSGFMLAYDIKKMMPEVPVIIITAVTNDTGFKFDRNSSGEKEWIKADAILSKPVRPEQLVKEINRLAK
jgi:CheY-like chemotaxis protein